MNDYQKEQEKLFKRSVITINPCLENQWVVESHNLAGEFENRIPAPDTETALEVANVLMRNEDDPPRSIGIKGG